MAADFCAEALDGPCDASVPPEIFNIDQGCQLTGSTFADRFKDAGVRMSTGGKDRCLDSDFIGRLWHNVKY